MIYLLYALLGETRHLIDVLFLFFKCWLSIVVDGDGKDNDCDGLVDEETRDRIDNDGDGLIDEDTALVIHLIITKQ